jgi:acetylornithine/N-succinyldiaminopimelate aminotransferase
MNNADNSYDYEKYNKRLMGNIVRMPLTITKARGSEILDYENDAVLLDFWGDEGVASLGYGEVFNDAVQGFIESGQPHRLPDVYPHELRWKAAEAICSRTGMDRLFFSNSGTEANEAAIKLARKYWWDREGGNAKNPAAERHRIMTLEGNFHGRTGYSLAASDFRVSPYHRHGFGPSPRGFGVLNDELKLVANNGYDFADYAAPSQPNWDSVAAIILAPVLGNNVVKTYPHEFWARLEAARKEHGFLLIYDDVQAGNGRAGHYATWQKYGVKPDIMTLSKGIAMGLPMAVTLASEEVAKSFTPGVHFSTFGGTLLCCHLAVELYDWLDDNLHIIRERGEDVRDSFGLREWIKRFDGAGLLNAFQPDFERFGYDGYQFITKARELGLSMVTHRQHGMIRFTPPLNVSQSTLEKAFEILDATHKQLATASLPKAQ